MTSETPNFKPYRPRKPLEALQYDERHPEAGIDGWLFGSQFFKLGESMPRAIGRLPAIVVPNGHKQVVRDGDWIVRGSQGGKFTVSRHDFDSIYEESNDAS